MAAKRSEEFDEKIYNSLCLSISERAFQVDWDQFNAKDWDRLYQTANKERVAALLYWSLLNSEAESTFDFPDFFLRNLRANYHSVWVHTTNLFQELSPVLEEMVNAGIQVVVLKGISLATSSYPDVGLRPMGDLDLLVRKPQLESAVHIAYTFGYKDTTPNAGRGLQELLAYNTRLTNTNNPGLSLEIHTSLIGSEAIYHSAPIDWFWEQIEPHSWQLIDIRTGGGKINIDGIYKFKPAAQIIYMCAHIMLQHGLRETSLIWLYDIHRLVILHGAHIDWKLLLTQAKKFNWEPALFSSLTLSHSLFNTRIPGEFISIMKDSPEITINEFLQIKSSPPRTRMLTEWQKLGEMNWNARLRLVSALLIPSPEYMRWRYRPERSWNLPYYYFYRWFDIFMDGVRSIPMIIRSRR